MAHLSFLSIIGVGLFILNPTYAPAQEFEYASVTYVEKSATHAAYKNEAIMEKAFMAFREQHQTLASIMQQQYPTLQDFSFDQQAALTHTFFTQKGQKMHVVFNKRNRAVLEVITLTSDTYPSPLLNTLQQDYPGADIVTVKNIHSEYGTWYEVVIREHDVLKKIEVTL